MSDEELGNLEWTETPGVNYAADFSFIDDYQKEVKVMLKAQAAKTGKIMKQEGIREAIAWVRQYHGLDFEEAKTQLKIWGIE